MCAASVFPRGPEPAQPADVYPARPACRRSRSCRRSAPAARAQAESRHGENQADDRIRGARQGSGEFYCRAGSHIRRAGVIARGYGNLRRAELSGVAPAAGDGHPCGGGGQRARSARGWSCGKGWCWPSPASCWAPCARWLRGAGWARSSTGCRARDPLSYGLALVLLPAAALLGCWRPARRAATANPADMIREE